MSWSLDMSIEYAGGRICALTEYESQLSTIGNVLVGHGRKVPCAIVLVVADKLSGVDLEGRALSKEDIAARFPGALETLSSLQ